MSLLKWQEMAKKKSALGKKINLVRNAITQKKLGEETSQIGFEKMFKPITSKLDDVVESNLGLLPGLLPGSLPARKRKAKPAERDYLPEVDPFEEMDVEGLFDEDILQPEEEEEEEIPEGPSLNYKEFMKEVSKEDPPPKPEEDLAESLAIEKEYKEQQIRTLAVNQLLTLMNIQDYNKVDKELNKYLPFKKREYLNKTILPEEIS